MVTLTTKYQKLCDELKSQTRTVNTAWWRIGEILSEIKDGKLYTEDKITWEAFCDRYVGFKKRHADSLIKNSETHAILEGIYRETGRTLPVMSESATQAVADLPPKQAMKTIEKVSKKGSVTAAKIRASRQAPIEVPAEVTESEAIEQARGDCPACGGTGERDTSISGPSNFVTCSNCQGSGKASRIGVCPHCGGAI